MSFTIGITIKEISPKKLRLHPCLMLTLYIFNNITKANHYYISVHILNYSYLFVNTELILSYCDSWVLLWISSADIALRPT